MISRRVCPNLVRRRVLLVFATGDATTSSIIIKNPLQPCRSFASNKDEEYHKMYKEQLQELQEEREAIYDFSKEEIHHWSTSVSMKSKNYGETTIMGTMATLQETIEKLQGGATNNSNDAISIDEGGSSLTSEVDGSTFTHLTTATSGSKATMVDVGDKVVTRRTAKARTKVCFPPEVMSAFASYGGTKSEVIGPKGPIFETARLAGIMGAKRTSELIPLCHPLPLDRVNVEIVLEENYAVIECECRVTHKTGVEMEALAGASIAALTIYDMVKAVSHNVRIEETRLVSKTGGKRNVEE